MKSKTKQKSKTKRKTKTKPKSERKKYDNDEQIKNVLIKYRKTIYCKIDIYFLKFVIYIFLAIEYGLFCLPYYFS